MSAFIVGNQCIENILNHLCSLKDMEIYSLNPLTELGYDLRHMNDPMAAKKLAKDMMAMNVASIRARYGTSDAHDRVKLGMSRCTPAQAYKSLACFLYQCHEGDIPQLPLFKALEKVKTNIAEDIVRTSAGYDELTWG